MKLEPNAMVAVADRRGQHCEVSGADPIIGDRAFSTDPSAIAILARAALNGLRDGGVVGCIKHMPGHGRAEADSHKALPRVRVGRNELGADFAPFRALRDVEVAMTAHIVFETLDPDHPATQSKIVIQDLIRKDFGFAGLLASDDLDMHALTGPLHERAEKALRAGCDIVLQCSGLHADMKAVMAGVHALEGESLRRAQRAEAIAKRAPLAFDAAAGWWRLRDLIGGDIGMTT